MKKIILSLLMLLAVGTASAQQRYVGYTVTDDISIRGGYFGTAGTYTIGALLSPQMLQAYEGCKIIGVRFALNVSIGRTRTFIYNIEGNQFVPLMEQKQRTYEGWNEVMINGDGIEIKGTENLFFGYDYVETEEMVTAEEGALCGNGDARSGGFMLYGNYGQGEGLYSLSNLGCLCVQLIVDVSSLPKKDIDLLTLDTGFKYKRLGEQMELFTSFINAGLDSITTYQLCYQIDDSEPVAITYADTLVSGTTETKDILFAMPADLQVGTHRLQFFVGEINGTTVTTPRSDTIKVTFAVYAEAMQRQKAYVEVYTQSTSYLSALLNKVMNKTKTNVGDVMCLVNVHRPGTPLAVSEADYLSDLYAYTYPSFTVNRAYFPNEAYIAYDVNDYLEVAPEIIEAFMPDLIMQDYYGPAFATVDIHPTYDKATRQLTVDLDGQLSPDAVAITGGVAVTVMLTENSVRSSQQDYNPLTGRVQNNSNYLHENVLRTYLTKPTGDAVSASANAFTARYTATLDSKWKPENMEVVVLVTKAADEVTDANVLDMDVIGANSMALEQTVGIREHDAETTQKATEWYSLSGMRLAQPARGLTIVKENGRISKRFSVRK